MKYLSVNPWVGILVAARERHVMPWRFPPRKQSPWSAHGRIIGPPGPNIAAIPVPPLLLMVPPAADCSLFTIAFATMLAYHIALKFRGTHVNFTVFADTTASAKIIGEQPGRSLLDQNNMTDRARRAEQRDGRLERLRKARQKRLEAETAERYFIV